MQNIKQKRCKYIDKPFIAVYNNNCYVTHVIKREIYYATESKNHLK